MDITVIIPTIPPRVAQLERALASVHAQTLAAAKVIVTSDTRRRGAAANRDDALYQVETEWTATLDDDDEFLPFHLERLANTAQETDADFVFSFPEMPVPGTVNPHASFNGVPWDRDNPRQTTVVALYKTSLAKVIGGYTGELQGQPELDQFGSRAGEDYGFTWKFNQVGKIVHHPEATWRWYHWGLNTSGLPSRW